jgi:hypothetical protein
MTISTYAELEDAVENWLHRSGLGDRTAEFIVLGEARIGREVKAREMEQRVSSTPTDTSESLPSDFVSMRAIRIKGGTIGWLDYMTPDEFFNTTASSSSSTQKKYTIFGDEIIFPITPPGDIELWYYKKLAALSSATNTLFTRNPDLYLYAALSEASLFLSSTDKKLAMFEGKYQSIKDSVNTADKQGRYPVGMSVKAA